MSALVLTFDPPVGLTPVRSRATNQSMQWRTTVCDVDGRAFTLAPGDSVEAVFVLGRISGMTDGNQGREKNR